MAMSSPEQSGRAPELQQKMSPEQKRELANQKLTAQLNEKQPQTIADIGKEVSAVMKNEAFQGLDDQSKQEVRAGLDQAVIDYVDRVSGALKEDLGSDMDALKTEVNNRLDSTI